MPVIEAEKVLRFKLSGADLIQAVREFLEKRHAHPLDGFHLLTVSEPEAGTSVRAWTRLADCAEFSIKQSDAIPSSMRNVDPAVNQLA